MAFRLNPEDYMAIKRGFYQDNTTIEDVRAESPETIWYGSTTCWWTHRREDLLATDDLRFRGMKISEGPRMPCDPRGGMLMETDDVGHFLNESEANPDKYGSHGIKAFMAAHHDNCFATEEMREHWCFQDWPAYNHMINRALSREDEKRFRAARRRDARRRGFLPGAASLEEGLEKIFRGTSEPDQVTEDVMSAMFGRQPDNPFGEDVDESAYEELNVHAEPGSAVKWSTISGRLMRGVLVDWDNNTAIVRLPNGKHKAVRA